MSSSIIIPEAPTPQALRQALAKAKRIVVKIGSRVLVQDSGRPETRRIRALTGELAMLRQAGSDVVFVTSGAIGAGMQSLGMKNRPSQLPELQMAAAVGQSRLMTNYAAFFAKSGLNVGQMLLTHDDLKHRVRHLNARNTMLAMLANGVIPIVNENDVVAVDEIRFGDNDLLASLVAQMIDADLLILLTTTNGLHRPCGTRTERVPFLATVTPAILGLAVGKGSAISTGGMASKLQAALAAAKTGAAVVIADGRQSDIIQKIINGKDTGTLIAPERISGAMSGRKRWIAFFHRPHGTLIIDEGARRALERHGRSLLPIGIKKVEGEFNVGAAVDIQATDKTIIARGLVAYSSRDIRKIQGRRSNEIPALLGTDEYYEEVIHRDNMAVII